MTGILCLADLKTHPSDGSLSCILARVQLLMRTICIVTLHNFDHCDLNKSIVMNITQRDRV